MGIQLNNGVECFDVHFAWRRQEDDTAPSSPYQTQIERKKKTETKRESVCEQQTTNNCVARSTACSVYSKWWGREKCCATWNPDISINCDYRMDNDNTRDQTSVLSMPLLLL